MRRLAILTLLGALACGERDGRWDEAPVIDGPFPLGDRLAFVNRATKQLVSLDPATGKARANAVLEDVRAAASDGARVLLIGGEGGNPELQLVGADGASRIALPSAYDRLELSPDGAFALALYDPAASAAAGAPAARNANELAVVDLAAGTARRELLGTESLGPRAVVFAPRGDRAAILLDSAIALLTLAGGAPLRVPLELADGARLTPLSALFSPDGAFLYVQVAGASDVLVLELAEGRASINLLSVPGGGVVRALALAGDAPELAHAVAALFDAGPHTIAALLDASGDTSNNHVLELDARLSALSRLDEGLLLAHDAPKTQGASGGAFVAAWEPRLDRADLTRLSGPSRGPVAAGLAGLAFVTHDAADGAGTRAVTLLESTRSASALRLRARPVVLGGALTAVASDPAGRELYLGVDVPREGSGAAPSERDEDDFDGLTGSIVVVRAEGLEILGVPLDASVTALGVLGERLYAMHPASAGDLSFVSRAEPTRATARRVDGFLLGAMLEGVAP